VYAAPTPRQSFSPGLPLAEECHVTTRCFWRICSRVERGGRRPFWLPPAQQPWQPVGAGQIRNRKDKLTRVSFYNDWEGRRLGGEEGE
jgi:hypothetical protein